MLKVENLTIKFGGLTAVNDVSFEVEANKIYGIIGPNGAGKTTLFNLLSGVHVPTSGNVFFRDNNINTLRPFEVNKLGMSRTYQVINLFRKMTVLENVLVGMHTQLGSGFGKSIFHTKAERAEEAHARDTAMGWLEFAGIANRAGDLSGTLPYGEQRKLEIVRALASKPELVLLDEPAAGMNSAEKEELRVLVKRILDELGVTVLIIEHDMKLMMGLADRIIVLNFGKKLAEGTPEEVQKNPDVIAAYLGGE